jgi:hypothetical protein
MTEEHTDTEPINLAWVVFGIPYVDSGAEEARVAVADFLETTNETYKLRTWSLILRPNKAVDFSSL